MRRIPQVTDRVLYYAHGSVSGIYPAAEARAAIVTDVFDPEDPEGALSLFVMTPQGSFHNICRYGPGEPGCWGWPARSEYH